MNRLASAASKAVRKLSFDSSSATTTTTTTTPTTSSSNNIPPKDSDKKNVGILAMEVYTPSTYIGQDALEEHSGVSKGRYTVGLGQEGMGLCGDCEDVNSLALTVVQSLLEK
jgi:hypothetical protein